MTRRISLSFTCRALAAMKTYRLMTTRLRGRVRSCALSTTTSKAVTDFPMASTPTSRLSIPTKTFPFSTLIYVDPKDQILFTILPTQPPISATETHLQVLTDTTGDPDREYWLQDSIQIVEEDKPLVNSQPPVMPLETGPELHHIPADRWSIRYRQLLVERFGLGQS